MLSITSKFILHFSQKKFECFDRNVKLFVRFNDNQANNLLDLPNAKTLKKSKITQ